MSTRLRRRDVLPLRVFYWTEAPADCDDDGEEEAGVATLYATFGDILVALDYAAARGADAANMSIGTPPIPPQATPAASAGRWGASSSLWWPGAPSSS